MGAALKGMGTFLPGISIMPQDRQVFSNISGYGLAEAIMLVEEGMAALRAGKWSVASAKAGTLYLLAGKYSTKFGQRDTAIRMFLVGNYIGTLAAEHKKAAARMKKAASMTGLAFKLANLKAYTTAISR